MRPNGTFRQADIRKIFKAAKETGLRLELELENGSLKIRPVSDKGNEPSQADDVVL